MQDARCFVSQLCEEWRVLLEAQEAETQADLLTRQARSHPPELCDVALHPLSRIV